AVGARHRDAARDPGVELGGDRGVDVEARRLVRVDLRRRDPALVLAIDLGRLVAAAGRLVAAPGRPFVAPAALEDEDVEAVRTAEIERRAVELLGGDDRDAVAMLAASLVGRGARPFAADREHGSASTSEPGDAAEDDDVERGHVGLRPE